MITPIAIRLLKQYRKGIVDQMQIIGRYDNYDSSRNSSSFKAKMIMMPKETEWKKALRKLKAVDGEIEHLENMTEL